MTAAKRVIIDADACPRSVRAIIGTLTAAYGGEMITVASFKHNIEGTHQHITVSDEPQAVDLAVINLAKRGDIVVTQDWGLAAVLLGKGAKVVSPSGRIYSNEKIDFLLEERHLKAKVRRSGGRTSGPAARVKEDNEQFARALEGLIKESISN